jgi:hypothetical protein
MRDPDEQLRRLEREIERLERPGSLEPRRREPGALQKLGGMGRAAIAVGAVVIGLAVVGAAMRLLPLVLLAAVVYGVYRLFYAPDRS